MAGVVMDVGAASDGGDQTGAMDDAQGALSGCTSRFSVGRRRFRLRAVVLVAAFTAVLLWSQWQGPSDEAATGLRGGAQADVATTPVPAAADEYAAVMGRRLSQVTFGTQNCSATLDTDLSIIGNIVGAKLCTSRVDEECTYCCTGFDGTIGVPVYFLIMLYMFLGLAIICDDYFCESLDAISEALNLSEDVAGATFMAAGSSAPELFTAIVTVLITGGSEGLGTIVGSAIFNIMIIVGVTAMFAGQELKVWWYPLTRDCVVYFISILLMVWALADKSVEWWESAILVVCYFGYIGLMVYNEAIVARVKKLEQSWAARASKKAAAKAHKAANPIPVSEKMSRRGSVEMRSTPVTNADISAAAANLARASVEASALTADAKAAATANLLANQGATSPQRPTAWKDGDSSTNGTPDTEANAARLKGMLGVGSVRSSPKVAPSPSPVPPSIVADNADGTARKLAPIALDKSADSASTMAASMAGPSTPSPQVGPAPDKRVASLASSGMRTQSNVSVSQVQTALSSPGPSTSLPKPKSGASMAGLAGAFGAPKAANKYKVEKKQEEEEKKAANPLHKSEFRRVWGGNKDKKKARSNKRAEKQVRVTMKVAVAASRFRKGLMRARSRNASPAGSPRTTGSAGGTPPVSKMMAALNRAAEKKEAPPAPKPAEDDDDDGMLDKILGVVGWPLAKAMQYTVPPCADEKWKKWYMLTFTMSIMWIGVLSYVMVDMASRAGCVLGVPGLVMGLVVLAAGTSVPDALSSILVAKLGQGDMAVANVLGSNVFNILLGLGLPWLARSLLDGHAVKLPPSEDIVLPVIVLLLYLAFFISVIALSKWKLSKTLGWVFIAAHFVFLLWNLLTLLPDPVIKL